MIPSEEICRYLNKVKSTEPWTEMYLILDSVAQGQRTSDNYDTICSLISDVKKEAVLGKDHLMYEAVSHISHVVAVLYNETE